MNFSDRPAGLRLCQSESGGKQKWALLIDDYLLNEEMLCHVLFLVDIRHEPTADDAEMYNFLVRRNLPFTVVATKSDKLPKSQIKTAYGILLRYSSWAKPIFFPFRDF